MKVNSQIILLFALPILLISCSKQKPPHTQNEMWECHQEETWDSVKMVNALLGEWEWRYEECFWTPDQASYEKYEGLSVEFKSDQTLLVKQDGQVTQTTTWILGPSDGDLFGVETDTTVLQLYGRIVICEKWISFNHSYVDGCDNYFKRK